MATNSIYFTFIGRPSLPKNADLVRTFPRSGYGRMGEPSISIGFGVRDDNNSFYVDAFDSPVDSIKTMNVNNERVEIDWDDRFDEDVVKMVAGYRKYVVDLTGERKVFITAYDMIRYLEQVLPTFDGDIRVNGQYRISPNTKKPGTTRTNFSINSVYAAAPDEKRRFSMIADLYYNKSSIDKSSLKEDGKIRLDSYVPMYLSKDDGVKFFPMSTVFDTSVYNMENTKHKKLHDFKLGFIDIKNKNIMHLTWELRCINGAQEVPFTEDMLTDMQRVMIELGEATLDDYRPSRGVIGERLHEFRLFKPVLRGDFSNGPVESGWTASEFEEQIYHGPAEQADPAPLERAAAVASDDLDEDDLF